MQIQNKKNKFSFLICSCDKYKFALYPFFKLFYKFVPSGEYDVWVNLENEDYMYEDKKINIYNLPKCLMTVDCNQAHYYSKNVNGNIVIPWSKRLKNCLREIQSKYVVLLLEDYFINSPVDLEQINQLIDIMEKDSSIVNINISGVDPDNGKKRFSYKTDGLEYRPRFGNYKLQASGIWNREKLIFYLSNFESPWEWEAFGNMRTWFRPKDKFLYLSKNKLPIHYTWDLYGSAIWHGKWNVQLIDSLFKENHIQIDYSKIGVVTKELYDSVYRKQNFVIRFLKSNEFIYKFIYMILHIKYLFYY